MNLFKQLSKEEEAPYREWARENYTRLDPIKGIWHPIVQDECRIMNEDLMDKEEEPAITMKELPINEYQKAYDCLDACNLSGVVNSLSNVLSQMIQLGYDNQTRDTHPITVLYVAKIMELSQVGCMGEAFSPAYDKVKEVLNII